MSDKIDGVYCRECGLRITTGYSWKGYCAVCAEFPQRMEAAEEFLEGLRESNTKIGGRQ